MKVNIMEATTTVLGIAGDVFVGTATVFSHGITGSFLWRIHFLVARLLPALATAAAVGDLLGHGEVFLVQQTSNSFVRMRDPTALLIVYTTLQATRDPSSKRRVDKLLLQAAPSHYQSLQCLMVHLGISDLYSWAQQASAGLLIKPTDKNQYTDGEQEPIHRQGMLSRFLIHRRQKTSHGDCTVRDILLSSYNNIPDGC